ncbi:hypothetical protein B0T16DRAFT_408114 [Cercophora newfieldiana]|uniref:Uncharacterized protein n=1 Tax=Cercophora newfieldiana TaxID=92897 RepID=A0AA39YBD2_9PEZI|nr:hypothetical protein B0T16DRAFT_408114 [Cercophora newfieldiana]
METIPGSYPADTPVATPQATPQQEPNMLSQPAPHHHGILGHHDHPERNKLHKPGHLRGHNQADSGGDFETTSSEPIQSKSQEPRTLPTLETAGDGAHATEEPLPFDEPKTSDSPPTQQDPDYTFTRHGESATVDQPRQSESKPSKDVGTKRSSNDNSPPYWGSLPKAATGGIYNTVMGHGSPKDDHAQHHNLPQRSAERAHVAGHTTDYPRGGVYNTVAGHGSQDEESKRHAAQEVSFAAPLPEIKEDKPLQLENMGAGKSDLATGGFLPVNADTELNSSTGAADQQLASVSETNSRNASTAGSGPRAFPLVSEHDRLDSQQSKPEDRDDVPESRSRTRDSTLMAAAATGAGTAMAVSEKNKPNKLKKRQESPTEETRGRKDEEHTVSGVIGGSLPRQPQEESESSQPKRGSSRSKSKSDEGSHASNAKKHSILGIFHRRKGSKGEAEEPKYADAEHHSQRKEEAAAAGAAGAGTSGLFHHHKEKEKNQRSSSGPMAAQTDRHQPSKRMSGNESAAATLAESAGAFGILYQKPTEESREGTASARPSDATAPSVPSKSEKRRSYSPRSSAALPEGVQIGDPNWESARDSRGSAGSQIDPSDSQKHSGSDAMKYAAAGTTAGIGASLFARDQQKSPDSRTGAPAFEHPREPPSTPFNASQSASSKSDRRSEPSPKTMPVRPSEGAAIKSGDYNMLSSGTASGAKSTVPAASREASRDEQYNHLRSGTESGVKTVWHSTDETPANAKGSLTSNSQNNEYNHLGSGTASGVKAHATGPTGQQAVFRATASPHGEDSSEEEYNVLTSGTPSGVKIKHRSQQTSFAEGADDRHHPFPTGDGQYDTLASGTRSADNAQQRERSNQPQIETQAARHTLIAAPMPMPDLREGSPSIPRETETRDYPSPEQAQEMSPTVLPESYRAQSHTAPGTEDVLDYPPPDKAKDMSPAVLPESYTAQSHAAPNTDAESTPSKASTSSSKYSEPEYTTKLTDPALAAATGAWAAKAGTSSGVPDRAKILHKCEHCGMDSDITSEFTRENMAKVTNKPGSTGNWWQNAWTSA